MEEKLKAAIVDALEAKLGYYRQPDGTFECEIYADYQDEMENKTAIGILRSDEPMDAFWEQMDYWYSDYEWQLRTKLENELRDELSAAERIFQGRADDAEICVMTCSWWWLITGCQRIRHVEKISINFMLDCGTSIVSNQNGAHTIMLF